MAKLKCAEFCKSLSYVCDTHHLRRICALNLLCAPAYAEKQICFVGAMSFRAYIVHFGALRGYKLICLFMNVAPYIFSEYICLRRDVAICSYKGRAGSLLRAFTHICSLCQCVTVRKIALTNFCRFCLSAHSDFAFLCFLKINALQCIRVRLAAIFVFMAF